MPKEAMLKLTVRHGDVQLAEHTNNIIASLTHTRLVANSINGAETYIKSSYAPVSVNHWNDGRLVVNYVKNCKIQKRQAEK